jgi:hypothetical protein
MKRAPIKPVNPPDRRAGARRPDDEDWWNDVLHDPRVRAPKQQFIEGASRFRLDWQSERIECRCRCGLHHWMDQAGRRRHQRALPGARMDAVPHAKQDGEFLRSLCRDLNVRQAYPG